MTGAKNINNPITQPKVERPRKKDGFFIKKKGIAQQANITIKE